MLSDVIRRFGFQAFETSKLVLKWLLFAPFEQLEQSQNPYKLIDAHSLHT